jgi:hypothetical protein
MPTPDPEIAMAAAPNFRTNFAARAAEVETKVMMNS